MERRNLRLLIEYDGTAYGGWQVQENAPSVQGVIEAAILRMSGESVRVHAAGRTDAGVHALGQVANFLTEKAIPLHGWRKGLNSLLPPDVAIREVTEVPLEFDARRHARGKLYRYAIWNHETRAPLAARTSWHVRRRLDEAAMQAAAAELVGRHDFRAFRAADCERQTTVRDIMRLDVHREGDTIRVEVQATAFLQHMVRIIVGTLVAVGHGRLGPAEVAAIRDAGDRTQAGVTAPPQGLCLVEVFY